MKAKIRVATDMYEFIELEVEGSEEQLWDTYKSLKRKTIPQKGLEAKEWNAALDRYLTNGDCDANVYGAMSDEQKRVIQEIKRSTKRINYKNGDKEE
jgi:hypothetical protein